MTSEANIPKALILLISLLLAGCVAEKTREDILHELKGNVFGAYYIVKYHGDLSPEKLQKDLDQFFDGFNAEFSTYQKDSVISTFNRSSAGEKLKVSSRFIEMLNLSKKFYTETNGAFEPTLGPIIQLWGFGGGKKITKSPSEAEIKKVMSKVGFLHVHWDEKQQVVWKTVNGLHLDVNAFAPGWAADLVGEILTAHKIENYMVDMSGEIVFKGLKPNSGEWITGIEKPSLKYAHGVHIALKMHDRAISTSGSYRQYFDEKGVRKSHIIDSKTGHPVTHNIASASVIAQNGAAADAWSTAMMVLGPQGIELAEKAGHKVLLLKAAKPNLFEEILSHSMKVFIKDYHL